MNLIERFARCVTCDAKRFCSKNGSDDALPQVARWAEFNLIFKILHQSSVKFQALHLLVFCEDGRNELGLVEQIPNKIRQFNRFDSGTIYTLSPEFRLVRGNPQRPGVLDWSS